MDHTNCWASHPAVARDPLHLGISLGSVSSTRANDLPLALVEEEVRISTRLKWSGRALRAQPISFSATFIYTVRNSPILDNEHLPNQNTTPNSHRDRDDW